MVALDPQQVPLNSSQVPGVCTCRKQGQVGAMLLPLPQSPPRPQEQGDCPGSPGAGRCLGAAAWGLGELRGSAPAAVSLPVYLVIPQDLLYPFTLSSHRTKDQTPGDLGLPLTLVVHHWLGHSVALHVSMGTKHVPQGPHESNSQNVWWASRAESRGPL